MRVRAAMVGASAALVAAGLFIAPHAPTSSATTEVVFSFTGVNQTWTVPAGVTTVEISLLGAGGAGGRAGGGSTSLGGGGGVVTGTLTVVPGDTLTIIVGQGGVNDNVREPLNHNYRFGGGGSGAGNDIHGSFAWGSGGGRSAVRSSNALYGTAGDVLTAGAGGGGGWDLTTGAGGAGGGLIGSSGGPGFTTRGGGGGTQTSGGVGGGDSEPGVAGIQYAGGYAVITGNSEGGGGGGGYYGGGGAGNNGGGGGGSSFLGSAAYFTGSTTAGTGRTPGTSTWPSACGTTPGRGADPGDSSVVGQGGNGCVVVSLVSSSNDSAQSGQQPLDPAPWLQAYARPTSGSTCLPGWSPSWAMWPNNNTGGFTCERRIEYVSGEWQAKPGYHD